mmetsp:Transcript_1604/g.3403  ORF Transcript_1604/g.3403 Transcript_1604/m.3403 type:complete len:80 (-) Transcript_1604:223-462(-)
MKCRICLLCHFYFHMDFAMFQIELFFPKLPNGYGFDVFRVFDQKTSYSETENRSIDTCEVMIISICRYFCFSATVTISP